MLLVNYTLQHSLEKKLFFGRRKGWSKARVTFVLANLNARFNSEGVQDTRESRVSITCLWFHRTAQSRHVSKQPLLIRML